MKQLVWSEVDVDGGPSVVVSPPYPLSRLGFYRDVALFAVPADPRETNLLTTPRVTRMSTKEERSLQSLCDGDTATAVRFGQPGDPGMAVIQIELDRPTVLSQLGVMLAQGHGPVSLRMALKGSADGKEYKSLHEAG